MSWPITTRVASLVAHEPGERSADIADELPRRVLRRPGRRGELEELVETLARRVAQLEVVVRVERLRVGVDQVGGCLDGHRGDEVLGDARVHAPG